MVNLAALDIAGESGTGPPRRINPPRGPCLRSREPRRTTSADVHALRRAVRGELLVLDVEERPDHRGSGQHQEHADPERSRRTLGERAEVGDLTHEVLEGA